MKKLSESTKAELLSSWRVRYASAERLIKSWLLDEFCRLTGHERKHAIKLLNGAAGHRVQPAGRRPTYGDAVVTVVHAIWKASGYMCGKRLKEAVPLWLPGYEAAEGRLPGSVRAGVLSISAAQLDRVLAPYRVRESWRFRSTKPGSLLREEIPVRTGPWTEQGPGWLEVDTVAHCGGTLREGFVWSVVFTDVVYAWTCLAAVWNRGQHGVFTATAAMEERLPFPLLGFDTDNGGEFINNHLVRYLADKGVKQTRSRPYRKNDNAHVEQKNWTHARQLLGYDRLGDERLVEPINSLHRRLWEPLQNYFSPSVKLQKKTREGSRYHKTYDAPQTPCARLLAWEGLPAAQRQLLEETRASLNPWALKAQLNVELDAILSRAAAVDGVAR